MLSKVNVEKKIIVCGSGGQGVLFSGVVLAWGAIEAGKHTTCFPSYGAEIRGGSSMSTVIISDEPIGSPVAESLDGLIALNELGYHRYIKKLLPGGIVVVNSSIAKVKADDRNFFEIPASELADRELGNILSANMVMIGYYIKKSGALSLDAVKSACEKLKYKKSAIELNKNALEVGYNYENKTSKGKRR